jgi:outer membrane autotransporter protein
MTTGYHFFNQGFTITPLASLQYTHLGLDNYTETGGGDINLKVDSQSYDFLESGLGVKVAHPLRYGDATYVPEMHFKWLRELVNPVLSNTAAFSAAGSPSFTTPGLKTSEDTLNLGVGLQFLSCGCTAGTWSLEAVYDHDWGSRRYSADQGMIRFTARF